MLPQLIPSRVHNYKTKGLIANNITISIRKSITISTLLQLSLSVLLLVLVQSLE